MMITKLVTDVDGILTDGMHYYTKDGKVIKAFASHDADAVKLFRKFGIDVVAITADARGFDISKIRLDGMQIPLQLVKEEDRSNWFERECNAAVTAFVGDGLWDVPLLKKAAMSFTPFDAVIEARLAAMHILPTAGGRGVLLEVLRFILSEHMPKFISFNNYDMPTLNIDLLLKLK